jgi:hypothetical protein
MLLPFKGGFEPRGRDEHLKGERKKKPWVTH